MNKLNKGTKNWAKIKQNISTTKWQIWTSSVTNITNK